MIEKENTQFSCRLRKRKLISYAENSDPESSFEHERFVNTYSRKRSVLLDQFELSVEEDGAELTEYERSRQRNIEEREKLFHELKIGEAKEELQAVASERKKTQWKNKSDSFALPSRPKSLRLQKKSPSGDPLPMKAETSDVAKSAVDAAILRKPPGPIPMKSTAETNCEEGILNKIVDCCKQKVNQEDFSPQMEFSCELMKFRKELGKLTLSPERIAKVVPHRICSMAVHPTKNELLLAVGDKWGNLGLWDVLSGSGSESVQLFQPHVGCVNCTSFCTYDATKIYTTSHDGTVRCGDLNKLVFDQNAHHTDSQQMPNCLRNNMSKKS